MMMRKKVEKLLNFSMKIIEILSNMQRRAMTVTVNAMMIGSYDERLNIKLNFVEWIMGIMCFSHIVQKL